MEEIWEPIQGYIGYEVSNLGNVKSKGRILSKCIGGAGYHTVNIYNKSGRKNTVVHKLVAEVFVPVVEGLSHINHIDGNKLNNEASNLEWCTHKQNMQHANLNGLIKRRKGKDVHWAKLVLNTQTGIFYETGREAAKAHNMNENTLRSFLLGYRENKTYLVYA